MQSLMMVEADWVVDGMIWGFKRRNGTHGRVRMTCDLVVYEISWRDELPTQGLLQAPHYELGMGFRLKIGLGGNGENVKRNKGEGRRPIATWKLKSKAPH
jgi:hypothetical protein